MKNFEELTEKELMELLDDDSFNTEVSSLFLCGYTIDNAIQTAIERRLEK